ncbi:MAG: hypothetical protein KDA41_12860, partial [Planctomycetales bacterium]|nr:hypothetical protein [Planctomycetales bacterium]
TEQYGDDELVIHTTDRPEPLVHFAKEQTVVVANNLDVAKTMLDVWTGKRPTATRLASDDDKEEDAPAEMAFEPLSLNQEFAAAMRRSKGTKEDPAQLTAFIDPISLFRVSTRGNFSAQAGLALLPVLGLDGLKGIGGSVTFATEDFDSITHVHVSLEEPRTGVLEMVALRPGDSTPENWAPADAASYTTVHWDAQTTYNVLGELYDSLRGEGRLAADVQARISEPLGVDFQEEMLGAFAGRVTYITWYERPARVGSEAALLAVKLNDTKKFSKTLDKLTEKYSDNLEKKSYGGVAYWQLKRGELAEVPPEGAVDVDDRDRRRQERRREQQVMFRQLRPSPCVAILDDYLIVCDRTSLFEKVVVTKSDASLSLANELDFKLIAGKIKRQAGGDEPSLLSFSRPEEGFKVLYEMATGDDTRKRLADAAEGNEFFGALDGALKRNELPPFAVIAQYLAPGGGMVTSDETGIHYTGFVLRRK